MDISVVKRSIRSVAAIAMAAGAIFIGQTAAASAEPSIEQFVVPPTLHRLQATVHHTQSDMDVLKKIGGDFAAGNRVNDVTYTFTAPDRVEAYGHYGILSGKVTTTNTTERYDVGIFHKTKDISRDITRRQTIASLGLLPQNYLDIMRSQYVGKESVDGVPCEAFILRYKTDQPDDRRRFETWVSVDKHYIVKQRVWDGGNNEHQTVIYRKPVEVMPGIWVPTEVDLYDAQGELGGIAEQRNISAS